MCNNHHNKPIHLVCSTLLTHLNTWHFPLIHIGHNSQWSPKMLSHLGYSHIYVSCLSVGVWLDFDQTLFASKKNHLMITPSPHHLFPSIPSLQSNLLDSQTAMIDSHKWPPHVNMINMMLSHSSPKTWLECLSLNCNYIMNSRYHTQTMNWNSQGPWHCKH